MNILKRVFGKLPRWPWSRSPGRDEATDDGGASHLALARESLQELISDARLPEGVRESLAQDYAAVQAMLDKLTHGHLHIAVLGRVSTGKSSLLNALIGEQRFSVSPLHGETKRSTMEAWSEVEAGGVYLIDTPGLDEAGGEAREELAREVAQRSDLVMFVLDGDITETERRALKTLVGQGRPVIVVLNKRDLYTSAEIEALLGSIREKTAGLVQPRDVLAVAAEPRPQAVLTIDAAGRETTGSRPQPPEVEQLRLRLWEIFESEGKTLAALNASLFAADLSDQVGRRILNARRKLGERLVRSYCVAKGVAVAFNPIPVADLFAAAFIDVGMVMHLSRVYGLPLSKREAGSLVGVIAAEAAALMGSVWALHAVSSALKVGSLGLSTILTAGAQGAIAYYSTYVVGRVAGEYLAQGKSWGTGGPKQVVEEILDSLDRETVLEEARREIRARLGLA
ncbi:MAG: GTP-binding protein [Gammaproteobacteria bacterium]|nr:GTP-binding protein [Gammaproteobacteria bacterium]MDH4253110.1 GTP-binding protein [Gammaproteobacteria bacterium]MDH5308936.1 GTP-binding protein [Gammaproteobacteria bacterium]